MDGSHTTQLFHPQRARRASDNCNCPHFTLKPVFAIDHSLGRDAKIYVVDERTSNIWKSDMEGCHCKLIVDSTRQNSLGILAFDWISDHVVHKISLTDFLNHASKLYVVVNIYLATTQYSLSALPPDSLSVDHQRLYWTNRNEGVLISIDKHDGSNLVRETLPSVDRIQAYGQHLQPLPGIAYK